MEVGVDDSPGSVEPTGATGSDSRGSVLTILWSTPRSASTAFEKAVMQHPRVSPIHEPFTDCYYFGTHRRSIRYGDIVQPERDTRTNAYAEIERPHAGKVRFVKELAFQALPYLDDSLLRKARHLFLIGEPDSVYASLVKLKPDFTEDEFGFTALLELYYRISHLQGSYPSIFTSRRFRNHPEVVLRRFCRVCELSFTPAMLHWQPGSVRAWAPHESQSQSKYHKTTDRSKTVLPWGNGSQSLVEVGPRARPFVDKAWRIFAELSTNAIKELGSVSSFPVV